MYYHRGRKMVYLAHPHTASRSTSHALLKLGFVKKGMENHHATLCESGVVTKDNRKDWTVFTTVRNHFDWILAQVWKIETASHPGPEIDWTDLDMWKRNLARSNWVTKNTLFSRHAPDADIVLNFETLGPDLEAVLGSVKLPRIGRNEHRAGRDYKEFYTPEARKWVEGRFGEEMRAFGYEF